jgi:hypothetical protein
MQDRYAGDVGDFSKYAILRRFIAKAGWTCGVIWYRYPCESHNQDGKHVNYFASPRFSNCDPELLTRLQSVASNPRSIAALEAARLLPDGTRYFSDVLEFESDRAASRQLWFEHARSAMAGCDLLMLDPDNGLVEPDRFRGGGRNAGKYAQLAEVKALLDQSRCVIVYHHFGRNGSHETQVRRWIQRIKEYTGSTAIALRYMRYSPRAYFILTRDEAANEIALQTANELTEGPWREHFQIFK